MKLGGGTHQLLHSGDGMAGESPSFRSAGIVTVENLRRLGLAPPENRMRRGPVAVVECPEFIPCNICVDACPFRAISMNKITDLPRIDWELCTGCGTCVALCPGLAIFVVDLSKPDKALVTVPHEFLPAPEVGEEVWLLGRDGRRLGKGKVVRVWERNKTWVVTVEVPKNLAMEVRAVWVER